MADAHPIRYSTTMNLRITSDPNICGGKPCIRHMRIRVRDILEMLAGGNTTDEILEDFPHLERDDILAAIAFAVEYVDHPIIIAVAAE